MFTQEELRPFHQKLLSEFSIPRALYYFKCEKCSKPFQIDSLRSISIKLNAKDLGEFAIEVHCRECNATYELMSNSCHPNILKAFFEFFENAFSSEKDFTPDFKVDSTKNNLIQSYIKTVNRLT